MQFYLALIMTRDTECYRTLHLFRNGNVAPAIVLKIRITLSGRECFSRHKLKHKPAKNLKN